MKNFKRALSMVAVAGVCLASLSAQSGGFMNCPEPIESEYENDFPNFFLSEESIVTYAKQSLLKHKEETYTKTLGIRKGNHLRPVPGVEKKHNEIIVQMQEAAGNGGNIIANSPLKIEGVDNLGDYSSAKSKIQEKLTIRPTSERNGQVYTTAEMNEIMENRRTATNDFSAAAAGMGAAETVNAASVAAESNPEERAKEVAKAETLAELYELMLGMDRRIYERSLHASAVEATNAGVTALSLLAGTSTINAAE